MACMATKIFDAMQIVKLYLRVSPVFSNASVFKMVMYSIF